MATEESKAIIDGIIARDSGSGDFENPEPGSYIARCYKLVDVGTQEKTYMGTVKKQRQLIMWLELLEDEEGNEYRMTNGQPFTVMQYYTLSTNARANLRTDIDAWRGKALTKEEAEAFDVTVLLDKYCRVQITLNESGDKTYTNVASVGFTKKKPTAVNEASWWTIAKPDMEAFEAFPDWLKKKVGLAEEWTQAAAEMVSGPSTPVAKTKDVVIEELPDGDPLDVEDLAF